MRAKLNILLSVNYFTPASKHDQGAMWKQDMMLTTQNIYFIVLHLPRPGNKMILACFIFIKCERNIICYCFAEMV